LPSSISSFVHRRGPVYWFRRSVPVDLIDRLGNTDIRRSLRTCNKRVARQRAWTLVLLVEEAFAILRDAGLKPGARDALNVVLGRVMDDFDRDSRAWAERAKYRMLLDSLNAGINDEASVGKIGQDTIDAAVAAPAPTQCMIDGQKPADMAPSSFAFSTDSARAASPVPAISNQTPEALALAVAEAMRLGTLHPEAKKPLTAHIEGHFADLLRKRRSPKYLAEIRTKLQIFIATMGDKPVFQYKKEDMLRYRDLIDQMPVDAIKHLKTDDPMKAIALNAKRASPLPPISSTTVDAKYLSTIRGIFDYLIRKGYLESNPVANVQSEQEADGEDLLDVEVRLPFTPEIEHAIYRLTSKKPKMSADYWWPRFTCRQGLRLHEFTQLCVSDFRELHGRLCVDLLHFDFDGDEHHALRRAQLQLKSNSARRIFPVARELLNDGLSDLIARRRKEDGPNARLFPDETADQYGNSSSALSKRANRLVRGITPDRRIVAYSARHTFAKRCDDAGIPLAVRNLFMGHEQGQGSEDNAQSKARGKHVSARYGSPLPTAEELAWFDKIRFD
jgi:integrase